MLIIMIHAQGKRHKITTISAVPVDNSLANRKAIVRVPIKHIARD